MQVQFRIEMFNDKYFTNNTNRKTETARERLRTIEISI